MATYTPSDISRTLDVPTSTVRRWARRFKHRLSAGAQRKNRLYNDHDLDIFSAIKSLSARNLTLDEIDRRLGDVVDQPSDRPPSEMALPGVLREITGIRGTLDEHTLQLVEMRQRLAELEAEAKLPWYKRIVRRK